MRKQVCIFQKNVALTISWTVKVLFCSVETGRRLTAISDLVQFYKPAASTSTVIICATPTSPFDLFSPAVYFVYCRKCLPGTDNYNYNYSYDLIWFFYDSWFYLSHIVSQTPSLVTQYTQYRPQTLIFGSTVWWQIEPKCNVSSSPVHTNQPGPWLGPGPNYIQSNVVR